MTYTFGETVHAADIIAMRIAMAEQKAADLQAALKLQQLEEDNARAEAALRASEARTRQAQADLQNRRTTSYPVHPNWKQHRTDAANEIRNWHAQRHTRNTTPAAACEPLTALQDVSGVVARSDNSRPAERHRVVAA